MKKTLKVISVCIAALLGAYIVGSVGACELGEISVGEMVVRCVLSFAGLFALTSANA